MVNSPAAAAVISLEISSEVEIRHQDHGLVRTAYQFPLIFYQAPSSRHTS